MEYLPISLIAGVLTAFSPCVLPLLPAVLGGFLDEGSDKRARYARMLTILASLGFSILAFTLLLKTSTAAIDSRALEVASALIIIAFGLFTTFPLLWAWVSAKLGLNVKAGKFSANALQRTDLFGHALLGLSLGPLFTSCSPTFALVIAVILPANPAVGITNLAVYVLGLMAVLLVLTFGGMKFIKRMHWLGNPDSHFRRILGLILVALGIMALLGLDKELQKWVVNNETLDVTKVERSFLPDSNVIIQ